MYRYAGDDVLLCIILFLMNTSVLGILLRQEQPNEVKITLKVSNFFTLISRQ